MDADEGKTIKVQVSFTDDAGNAETLTSASTSSVAAKPNSQATGAPTITGTARVGETLTADTSGLADDDGLTNVSYSYQWIANDGNSDSGITDATGSSYTLVDADEGKTIKVRVSFTDDAGNAETLTSASTSSVAAKPNSQATGAPTITGTARVGETLTADTSGLADDDGLTNVSYSYQWIANDGNSDSNITGATGSSYTLVAADEGKTIKVQVSFTDDVGNAETLTSATTGTVQEEDDLPEVSVTAGAAVTEGANATFTLTMSQREQHRRHRAGQHLRTRLRPQGHPRRRLYAPRRPIRGDTSRPHHRDLHRVHLGRLPRRALRDVQGDHRELRHQTSPPSAPPQAPPPAPSTTTTTRLWCRRPTCP